jgi:hypothetical protein
MTLIFTNNKLRKIAFAGKKKVQDQGGYSYSNLGSFVSVVFIFALDFSVIICQ